MRTLKQTLITLSLVLVYGAASAETSAYQESMPVTINSYIDAVAYGKTDKLEDIIDNRAVFTVTNGNTTKDYDKKAIVGLIKINQGIQQNCETSFKIIENNDKRAQIKVFYKYENFMRVDNVTLTDTRNGWKITKVASSFI